MSLIKKIMNKFCKGMSQIRVALWTLLHGTKSISTF